MEISCLQCVSHSKLGWDRVGQSVPASLSHVKRRNSHDLCVYKFTSFPPPRPQLQQKHTTVQHLMKYQLHIWLLLLHVKRPYAWCAVLHGNDRCYYAPCKVHYIQRPKDLCRFSSKTLFKILMVLDKSF